MCCGAYPTGSYDSTDHSSPKLRTSLHLTRPDEGSPNERTTAVRRAALAQDIRISARIIELRRLAEQTARDGLDEDPSKHGD